MSQTSSGPPDTFTEIFSLDSPSLHEQGILNKATNTAMDTSKIVTRVNLANTDFLINHPAPRRISEQTTEHLLFFEDLFKEATSLTDRIHKFSSAAYNARSPTWEKTSLQIAFAHLHIHRSSRFPSPLQKRDNRDEETKIPPRLHKGGQDPCHQLQTGTKQI
ncbi:hypothetical protein CDAR_507021 [Caerostris darwini]|uniref:Uncharacterized protein n=1 Tax=Caerostris darwini TaxID=1538125 RepID=A0AAV4MSG4_9ARAC|nr:hypothetical protein CDAR_507021 [Caerostris darwini]